jgi:L-threonylcarbamoyladenylate synthase
MNRMIHSSAVAMLPRAAEGIGSLGAVTNGAARGPRIVDANDPDAVSLAADVLRRGGLVGIPTETVYGLAADMRSRDAVARVYRAKGRPASHPLIVHLADAADLPPLVTAVPAAVDALTRAFWPGPLSLLIERSSAVPDDVVGGRSTAVFRVPAQPATRLVIRALGSPVVAPSANPFGGVSPTTAAHVVESLGAQVDLVLDGGPCPIGVESTILDTTVSPMQLLRPGAVLVEEIEEVLGAAVAEASGDARAPGMLSSHYAPHASVILAASVAEAFAIADALPENERPERLLGVDLEPGAFAASLYASLRLADDDGVRTVIAVVPPPLGIGRAVGDRLRRASGRRSINPR